MPTTKIMNTPVNTISIALPSSVIMDMGFYLPIMNKKVYRSHMYEPTVVLRWWFMPISAMSGWYALVLYVASNTKTSPIHW